MITVQVDEEHMDQIVREELKNKLETLTHRHTFWDIKELARQTSMSESFIKQQFFYDERFPKRRVGKKWLMPAAETEAFLLAWLQEQARF